MGYEAAPNQRAHFSRYAARHGLRSLPRRRLNAVLKYLDLIACTSLPDYAEHDINTVTNIARIMVQDVSDVFRVIEQRGFEAPTS
ncbi:hypothetical protein [Pseudomonas sp. NPDC087817]|uniref:hypothetical protein n=1 Tax=Pseudomonas sp. NPDC087817 TaxID=3364451 RepID=UPI00382E1D13